MSAASGVHADVLVIGAGAVGASVAYELSRRGVSVHVVDAGATVGAGCSYANAGLVAPSHVEPLVTPASLKEALRSMARPDGPVHVSLAPQLWPFLGALAGSARPGRALLLTERLRELAVRSLQLHEQYAEEGLTGSLQRKGLMDVFLTDRRFEDAVGALRRHPDALRNEVLDADEVRRIEPTLGDVAGGLLHPDEAHCDSREFVDSMLRAAVVHGARMHWDTTVRRLTSRHGRILAAETDRGRITAGAFVVAAGLASQSLCRGVGIRLPMRGGRGYVIDVEIDGPAPHVPVSIREPRVIATPYPGWLRMCGTLELVRDGQPVNPGRVQAVREGIGRALPSLRTGRTLQTWAGQRPCTADGVPVIGRSSGQRNLVVAAGHAMWGLTLGPATGEIVAQGLVDEAPVLHEPAFSPDRFGSGHRPGRVNERPTLKQMVRHSEREKPCETQ